MYLLNITYNKDRLPKEDFKTKMIAHHKWFKENFENDNFLVVGSYRDDKGGAFIIVKNLEHEQINNIISKDSFYPDFADYEVRKFQPKLVTKDFYDFREE